jgi:murein L,D-transpeptidase YcbB/YkuD
MPQPRRYTDQAARQAAYRARQADARATEQQAQGLPPAPFLPSLPSRARWQALLTQARHALQTAADEMQAYYDDRSPAWQDGERAAALQEQLDALAQALEDLDAVPP